MRSLQNSRDRGKRVPFGSSSATAASSLSTPMNANRFFFGALNARPEMGATMGFGFGLAADCAFAAADLALAAVADDAVPVVADGFADGRI